MPANEGVNQRGFFENLRIYEFHQQLLAELGKTWHDVAFDSSNWLPHLPTRENEAELEALLKQVFEGSGLWGVKDPRMCHLLPLWLPVLDRLRCSPRFLLVHRKPQAVAASLTRRDGFSADKGTCLWIEHTLAAERMTRGLPRVFVSFDELRTKPVRTLQAIGETFELEWPRQPPAVAQAIRDLVLPVAPSAEGPPREASVSSTLGALAQDLARLVKAHELSTADGGASDFDALAQQYSKLFSDPVKALALEHIGQVNRESLDRVASVERRLAERTDWIRLLDHRLQGLESLDWAHLLNQRLRGLESAVDLLAELAQDHTHWRALAALSEKVDGLQNLVHLAGGIDALAATKEPVPAVAREKSASEAKLVMTLLVRDEEDILETQLEYHLARGVDHFIVTDNLSVDETPEILARYEARGLVTVIREDSDDYSQGEWVTRMARSAFTDHQADWVINSDADEFWWPAEGSLKSVLAELEPEVGVVPAARTNFVPVQTNDLPFYQRMVIREKVSLNLRGLPLDDKVCHRGHAAVVVEQGNHGVDGTSFKSLQGQSPISILHFPMRNYSQFKRKIVNGGRAYEQNTRLNRVVGDAWRKLYRVYQEGGLRAHYDQRELSDEQIREGIQTGALIHDDRLLRFLESRVDAPPGGTGADPGTENTVAGDEHRFGHS